MCLACLELQRLFNKSIKKAIEQEDKSLESRLKEKREYFLREVFEQDHNTATNLLLQTNDDEIDKDSQVLDGKRWEDLLADSFIKREPSPFPPPAAEDLTIRKTISESIQVPVTTTESKSEHLPFDPYSEPFYGRSGVEPITTYCSHEWLEYQGAGTRSPEIICRFCGQPKPAI